MSDFADQAENEAHLFEREEGIKAVRRDAAKMEQGYEGDCEFCGRHFSRVVARWVRGYGKVDLCGGCRDEKGIQ